MVMKCKKCKKEKMTLKSINLLFHNDQAVMLKEFPNKFFNKHWDDIKKTDYIIVENKKNYLNDLLKNYRIAIYILCKHCLRDIPNENFRTKNGCTWCDIKYHKETK